MNAETDARQRERAESAYRALLSRLRETPGLDLDAAFNKRGPGGELSPNELFAEAGGTLEQRKALYESLWHAKRCAEGLDAGELHKADRNLDRFRASIAELRADGLLSDKQLQSMESDAKVWSGRIESGRPEAFRRAQAFFADNIAKGEIGEEAIKKNAEKFYDLLRDAGLDHDRASLGFHAFEDGMTARRIERLGQSGEMVEQPLQELRQSIEFAKKSQPPFLDAQNLQRMNEVQASMESHRAPVEVPGGFVPIRIEVRDEAAMEKIARENAEKLQALMGWYGGKNEWHSIGGFYGSVFQRAPDSITALNDALEGKTPGDRIDNLQKAIARSDLVLNAVNMDHRNKSPQELVKIVDDIRETMFKNADIVADAVGVLPGIGPRAKFLFKETAIGLRYMSGDYTATEAIGATIKESISAVLGDQRFKDAVIEKYGLGKTGEDLLIAMGGAIVGNVVAETSKLLGQNDLSSIGPKKIAMAIETGIVKGIVEGGFKIAEKYDLDNKTLQEVTKLMVRVAQKFGVERPVDQEIDRWLKSQNKNGKSYSLNGEGDATGPLPLGRENAAFKNALAAIVASDLPGLPRQQPQLDNTAAALATSMEKAGVRDVGTLMLNNDGSRLIAVQGAPGASDNRLASVELRQSAQTPSNESLTQLSQQQNARLADASQTAGKETETAKRPASTV